MADSKKQRILVISNACFSNMDSNGRTLAQLLKDLAPDELAQFYTYGTPDFSVCREYYQVSDGQALKSFLTRKQLGGPVTEEKYRAASDAIHPEPVKKFKKTPLTMLLRELAWKYGAWNGQKLGNWLQRVSPSAIFLFTGDNAFLLNLAGKIARQYGIPIYVYSTEDYCLKNFNYLTRRPSLFYSVFHRKLMNAHRRIEPLVEKAFFNTDSLSNDYAEVFRFPCEACYAKSDIDFQENADVPQDPSKICVSYLGNMGVGRHKALIEIADALAEVVPGSKLNIYGRIPECAAEEMLGNSNIRYCGFISYGEVVKVMHDSTLLVHAEANDPFYNQDLKHAFSTKIADSICCGTPLFMYAPPMLAETEFLLENQCAFVATDKKQLKPVLKEALLHAERRKEILKMAGRASERFFCAE